MTQQSIQINSEKHGPHSPCCDFSCDTPVSKPPSYTTQDALQSEDEWHNADFLVTIESTIDSHNRELRDLSLAIHGNPELGLKEFYAHHRLTAYMEAHGFTVTRHHLGIETAWRAEFAHGHGGRIIGLQSEMDALPNLGHACGHNLIAITGVAIALGLRAAMLQHDIPGKIILLGTPAEEHEGGKIKLLEKGAYKEMDVCLMAHPGPGVPDGTVIQPWIAVQNIEVEFFGHTAHAAYAPWEGQNALDAAFLAYSAVSVLRQQIKPTHRVQVIPDYAKMRWAVRAPSWTELEDYANVLLPALSIKVTPGLGTKTATNDALVCNVSTVRHSVRLTPSHQGNEYLRIANSRYNMQARQRNRATSLIRLGDISYGISSLPHLFKY
ncbi:hypothetical protein BC629DRAFT_1534680 [Irpex lacteus]|nr:hypothetical protein BC629DRAFT_1534680 [Irpex lacteus]